TRAPWTVARPCHGVGCASFAPISISTASGDGGIWALAAQSRTSRPLSFGAAQVANPRTPATTARSRTGRSFMADSRREGAAAGGPQVGRVPHDGGGQWQVFELRGQCVEDAEAVLSVGTDQLAADFVIRNLWENDPPPRRLECGRPLPAGNDVGRVFRVRHVPQRSGVEDDDCAHQVIPFSSGGYSIR